ncbi:MAG: tRNA lysidine(34) synthetase TilS [bacterium]
MAKSARSKSADPLARVHGAVARALEQASAPDGASGLPSVCVGLSGGVDSVVLLHAFAALAHAGRVRLSAVHVHHGLSPNADRWASFCRAQCRRLQVPLSVARVVVDRASGLGIEAAARQQRQRVFAAQPADWIALGHHRDDQAETVLLQLLRGAGLRGLSGMPEGSEVDPAAGRPRMLRPFLDLPRAALEACARQQGLSWIEDESNADTAFDRNFIRHAVMPLLEQRFASARASLARSGRLLAASARLVEAIAAEDLHAALEGSPVRPAGVSLGVVAAIGEGRARELLREWLRRHGVPMPPERRLAEAIRQACEAGPERAVEVVFDGVTLRRYRDRLYLDRPHPADAASGAVAWNRRAKMVLPALGGMLVAEPALGAGIAQRLLRGAVLTIDARTRSGGPAPRMAIGEPPMRRTLKNLWQESSVPPWQRDRWPLLRIGGELACVPGVAVAGPFEARPGEAGRVFRWLVDG